MLQQIEEPCSLGVHAAVVIPPTWILRARRPQVSPARTLDPRRHLGSASHLGPPTLSPTSLLPLQNTLKASKKKKRASFKRKSSKKGPEVRPGTRWAAGGGGNRREGPVWGDAEPPGLMLPARPPVGQFGLCGPEEGERSDPRCLSMARPTVRCDPV